MTYKKVPSIESDAFGTVAVLYGGLSAEREISLQSGNAVLQALQAKKIHAIGVDVDKDIISRLQEINPDRVFIALHGVGGEDGKVQGMLDWLGIPYTGSDHAASSLAMNKLRTKQIWTAVGLPTPKYQVLTEESDWLAVMDSLQHQVFVKPVNEGSSLGMSFVNRTDELEAAYKKAVEHDHTVIAEQRVDGKEFTVSVLNGQALPPIQLKTDHVFYDYDAKYISDDTQYLCPCGLTKEKIEELQSIALRAFHALGCKGWGRIDFMQDQNEQFYLLEANTVPGMTSHSLVPMAAKNIGLDFEELVFEILAGSVSG